MSSLPPLMPLFLGASSRNQTLSIFITAPERGVRWLRNCLVNDISTIKSKNTLSLTANSFPPRGSADPDLRFNLALISYHRSSFKALETDRLA